MKATLTASLGRIGICSPHAYMQNVLKRRLAKAVGGDQCQRRGLSYESHLLQHEAAGGSFDLKQICEANVEPASTSTTVAARGARNRYCSRGSRRNGFF
jgi:hypothetical protein